MNRSNTVGISRCRRPTPRARSRSPASIRPATTAGRPHIHFEFYPSLAKATNGSNKIATSQLALPEEASKAVYPTVGYEQSVQNLNRVSLDSDNVFGDGYDLQVPEVTGDAADGYRLTFRCAV